MSAETPNPQPGDRVQVSFAGMLCLGGGIRCDEGDVIFYPPGYATVEVLQRALCAEIEGATGIRCQQPTGHVDGHKGTTTEEQAKAVGYPLFVSWPAESEQPARRSVRVPNEPHGIPLEVRQKVLDAAIVDGKRTAAELLQRHVMIAMPDALAYVESMSEYQTYLAAHDGRTKVDPDEADRMRAMGFDKKPEFQVSDEDRTLIQSVLDERANEYVYGGANGWKLDSAELTGVVADIVWAALKRDRERGGSRG